MLARDRHICQEKPDIITEKLDKLVCCMLPCWPVTSALNFVTLVQLHATHQILNSADRCTCPVITYCVQNALLSSLIQILLLMT